MRIDLDNKKFITLSNSSNGEVGQDTIFHYHQLDQLIWAEYSGESILKGFLVGRMLGDNVLEFVYHHVNSKMEIMTGKCTSQAEIGKHGKIVLNEKWQWTCSDSSSGESILIEL